MFCLIAAEDNIAGTIKSNLSKMSSFSKWEFEVCTDGKKLEEWSDRNIDVLVLSRYLPGEDPVKLLLRIRMLFPSSHIVLLVGQITESCRAYMRAANRCGLYNTVTGKLPGSRPYNLMTALTRPKRPEMDGYDDLGDTCEGAGQSEEETPVDPAEELVEMPEKPPAVLIAPEPRTSATEPKHEASRATGSGVLVVSTANKGGVGKTTTAIAVATALGRAGVPTALVDLDLGAPDLATFFKIQGVPGIERLANLNRINPAQIDRLLIKAENDLFILPGPMNGTLPHFNGGELATVLDYLKSKFPVVICDTSPEPWTKRWLYEVFEAADMALAVVDQSKFSEEETKKYAPTLLAMGMRPERIRIVVNRYSPKLHNVRVIETMFCSGFKKNCNKLPRIGAVIQDNWNASVQDTYKGEIAGIEDAGSPWHKLAKEIAGLAGYRYERASTGKEERPSLLAKIFGKGGQR